MGFVVEFRALKSRMSQQGRPFLTAGILGGFTTFSSFALEIGLLHSRGELVAATIFAIGSAVGGIAALFAGMAIVRALS